MQSVLSLKESNTRNNHQIQVQEYSQSKIKKTKRKNIIMVVDLSKAVRVANAIITAIGITVGSVDLEEYKGILL